MVLVKRLFLLLMLQLLSLSFENLLAQQKVIKGVVKDAHSDEIIPFASVTLMKSSIGKLTDSSGHFIFHFNSWPADTLEVSYVGYAPFFVAISDSVHKDTINLSISLERSSIAAVVVRSKFNRGIYLWRKIVKNKPNNDRYRFDNFSYELYNKLELDLNNINKDKLKKGLFTKPVGFIFDNIDTTEEKPFLPVYLTESISDYFYQKSPRRYREVFKGSKTIGIENQSLAEKLGGMDQNINIYNNFIPVFDKQFVSPISDNGSAYYEYRVSDTQYIAGKRFYHLVFSPRRKGESTFEGDCWVHDSSFAIQKMNLRLGKEANINFVEKLSLIQEYKLIDDSTWFLYKDKFVVNIYPIGKSKFGFIGRKTTTYKDVKTNADLVTAELKKNKVPEETVFPPEVSNKTDVYWEESRHESLSKNEANVYAMIDTLQKIPIFNTYKNIITFVGTGYHNIGNFEIGPWYNWISGNSMEGFRTRFDLGTNNHFHKNLWLTGYLAYGFTDKRFKGKASAFYLLNRHPRMYIYGAYQKDLDNGQTYYDEISADNIFALAVRKPNVPLKFMQIEEEKFEFFKEWQIGFSMLFNANRKIYNPLLNLPSKQHFTTAAGEPLNNFETSLRLRFAYLEKFLEGNFLRVSLGSPLPIVEFKYSHGFSNVLKSSYNYNKVSGSISDYYKIPPFGSVYYNVFGGRTIGTLPYMLLDIAPGNEIYYYNKYAFNMMNRYEFIGDRYTGFNVEHNFGNGIFRFTPLTRKLKLRQFWSAKGIWSTLSEKNKTLNFLPDAPFRSLDGKMYLELGTGVDNILKVFRVDFVWRVLPSPTIKEQQKRFGVFGSFRLAF